MPDHSAIRQKDGRFVSVGASPYFIAIRDAQKDRSKKAIGIAR